MATVVRGAGVALLTEAEARELTDRINAAADDLWRLVTEAFEREAWRALGYGSWKEYAVGEFKFSRQRSYQLLDQGRVIKAIAEASHAGARTGQDVSTVVDTISEREARELKPRLPKVTAEIRERVQAGEEPRTVVRDVVQKTRTSSTLRTTADGKIDALATMRAQREAAYAAAARARERCPHCGAPIGGSGRYVEEG